MIDLYKLKIHKGYCQGCDFEFLICGSEDSYPEYCPACGDRYESEDVSEETDYEVINNE